MNKKIKVILMCALSSLFIIGCKNDDKVPSNSLNSSSSSSSDVYVEHQHKKVVLKESKLACLRGSGKPSIAGDNIPTGSYLKDPVIYNGRSIAENIIESCPIGEMKDELVIYTPDFWKRTTPQREDEVVVEYVVKKVREEMVDGKLTPIYEIVNEYQKTDTIIPIDGFVISVPGGYSTNAKLEVGQQVDLNSFTLNSYDTAVYSETGRRVPISSVNPVYMPATSANLFDVSSDTKRIWGDKRLNTILFEYESESSSYKAVHFDQQNYSNNLNIPVEGFMLANQISLSNTASLLLEKGVIFDENEKVYLESPVGLYNEKISYKIGYQGSYVDGNGVTQNIGPNVQIVNDNRTFNEWGYEFAIVDGRVVDHAVNLSHPANGYRIRITGYSDPIEGHIATLKDQFKIGVPVQYDSYQLVIDHNLPNFATQYLGHLENKINQYINKYESDLYDIDITKVEEIKAEFQKNATALETVNLETTTNQYHYQNRIKYAKYLEEQAYLYAIAPEPVETRSIWHYPLDSKSSVQTIQTIVDKIKDANFNEVIVSGGISEVNNYGLVYHSKYANMAPSAQNDYGKYKDYLDAFVSIAHEAGLKVQVSMSNWFLYQEIIDKHPEYGNYFATNFDGSDGLNNGGEITKFLDPANPIVRQLYLDMYQEIIDNYDVDGFHLDYIRYGAGNEAPNPNSQGYTQAALDGFKEAYPSYNHINDLTTFKTQLKTSSAMYKDFCDYRRSVVTNFVADVRTITQGKQLTIAVVSNVESAKNGKLQDWETWLQQNYIDSIYLMAYYLDSGYVIKDSLKALQIANNSSYVVSGISPVFSNLEIMEVPRQFEGARSTKVQGTALFASHSFGNRPELGQYLKGEGNKGAYRQDAIVSYENLEKVTKAFVDTIKDRTERIYKEYMSESQKAALQTDLEALLATKNDVSKAYSKISEMITAADNQTYGMGNIEKRLIETLTYAQSIYIIKSFKEA